MNISISMLAIKIVYDNGCVYQRSEGGEKRSRVLLVA